MLPRGYPITAQNVNSYGYVMSEGSAAREKSNQTRISFSMHWKLFAAYHYVCLWESQMMQLQYAHDLGQVLWLCLFKTYSIVAKRFLVHLSLVCDCNTSLIIFRLKLLWLIKATNHIYPEVRTYLKPNEVILCVSAACITVCLFVLMLTYWC